MCMCVYVYVHKLILMYVYTFVCEFAGTHFAPLLLKSRDIKSQLSFLWCFSREHIKIYFTL